MEDQPRFRHRRKVVWRLEKMGKVLTLEFMKQAVKSSVTLRK